MIGLNFLVLAIVGNKIDLTEKEEVSLEEGSNLAKVILLTPFNSWLKEYGAIFKLTSAKEGKGIQVKSLVVIINYQRIYLNLQLI